MVIAQKKESLFAFWEEGEIRKGRERKRSIGACPI